MLDFIKRLFFRIWVIRIRCWRSIKYIQIRNFWFIYRWIKASTNVINFRIKH